MKVRMKVHVTGTRDGRRWPPVGETIELPDQEAADMCAQGYCEPVGEKPRDRSEQRDHVCDECGFTSASAGGLASHSRVHK